MQIDRRHDFRQWQLEELRAVSIMIRMFAWCGMSQSMSATVFRLAVSLVPVSATGGACGQRPPCVVSLLGGLLPAAAISFIWSPSKVRCTTRFRRPSDSTEREARRGRGVAIFQLKVCKIVYDDESALQNGNATATIIKAIAQRDDPIQESDGLHVERGTTAAPSFSCSAHAVDGKIMSGVVVATTIKSTSESAMPAVASAWREAASARSLVCSSGAAICREQIPVRVRTHSSLVSMRVASSALVSTLAGR